MKENIDIKKENIYFELHQAKARQTSDNTDEEVDSLDSYMTGISESLVTDNVKKLEKQLQEIEKEEANVKQLLNISQPALDRVKRKMIDIQKNESTQELEVDKISEVRTTKPKLSTKPIPNTERPTKKQFGPALDDEELREIRKETEAKQEELRALIKAKEIKRDIIEEREEEEEEVFNPPDDQTGNGITSLNAKYGY